MEVQLPGVVNLHSNMVLLKVKPKPFLFTPATKFTFQYGTT